MINFWRRIRLHQQQIGHLYQMIIGQSRSVEIYQAFSIPDTIDGRYEVLVLHTWLILQRLRNSSNQQAKKISQGIFDSLITDFDLSLKEIGVGDKKLGKQVRFMVKGAYGRFHAYDQSWSHPSLFLEALTRNFFGASTPSREQIDKAYHYILDASEILKNMTDDQLVSGNFIWPMV